MFNLINSDLTVDSSFDVLSNNVNETMLPLDDSKFNTSLANIKDNKISIVINGINGK